MRGDPWFALRPPRPLPSVANFGVGMRRAVRSWSSGAAGAGVGSGLRGMLCKAPPKWPGWFCGVCLRRGEVQPRWTWWGRGVLRVPLLPAAHPSRLALVLLLWGC